MVNGIAQNYGYGNYYLSNTYFKPIDLQQGQSIYGDTTTLTGGVQETRDNTADGKDDGSIGFWGATKNLAKGAWNFLTSPFKNDRGEWSLTSTLKSAAIAGLFIAGNALTGGALTPILLAGGAIAGVWGAGKAAYNIATAETDAQAEAAWQSMGSSAATIAATAVGAKSYAKSSAVAEGLDPSKYDGVTGTFKAVGKTFVDSKDNIATGITKGWNYGSTKFGQISEAYKEGTLKTKVADKYHSIKESATQTYKDAKTAYKEYKEVWDAVTPEQKRAFLKNSLKEIAKENFGSNRKEVLANAKEFVTNPRNLAIHSNLASQTVKPNFYDSLSEEEQAYFDSLPDEQKEQLEDYYYSMV